MPAYLVWVDRSLALGSFHFFAHGESDHCGCAFIRCKPFILAANIGQKFRRTARLHARLSFSGQSLRGFHARHRRYVEPDLLFQFHGAFHFLDGALCRLNALASRLMAMAQIVKDCRFLGGRSFSSDNKPLLFPGVLTPEDALRVFLQPVQPQSAFLGRHS